MTCHQAHHTLSATGPPGAGGPLPRAYNKLGNEGTTSLPGRVRLKSFDSVRTEGGGVPDKRRCRNNIRPSRMLGGLGVSRGARPLPPANQARRTRGPRQKKTRTGGSGGVARQVSWGLRERAAWESISPRKRPRASLLTSGAA